jgi:tetratricopeptide (TPR) repeat protein
MHNRISALAVLVSLIYLTCSAPSSWAAASAEDYYRAGKQMAAAGDYARAKLYLEAVVKLDPAHWQAWQALGNACVRLGQDKLALTAYQRSLTINPNNPPLTSLIERTKKNAAAGTLAIRPAPKPLVRPKKKPLQEKKWQLHKQYLGEVLLKPNRYLREKVCYQWANPPSLSIIGGNKKQDSWVAECINTINQVLHGTRMQIIQRPNNDKTADILLYINYPDDFDLISDKHDFKAMKNRAASLALAIETADGKPLIENAAIFITNDYGLDETRLNTFVFLYHILGVRNYYLHTKRMDDIELSAADKDLLRFYYTHIKPGDAAPALEEAFEKFYPELRDEDDK